MVHDVEQFCCSCLHCQLTTGGNHIPRPYGHSLHAEKPNEILHFDFLYMGPSTEDMEYIFLMRDDASSFVMCYLCDSATATAACKGLISWFSIFSVVPVWVSDQGPHFKNQLLHDVNKALHTHHHFTTPHAPQGNGSIERICREVLRCCRSLLSELRMKPDEWPIILPMIQSVLNHSPRRSLNNMAPITLFTGQPAENALELIFRPSTAKVTTFDNVKTLRTIQNTQVLEALDGMHREVFQRRTKDREAQIKIHNSKTNVQMANFDVGDFVLVAENITAQKPKLALKWGGPCQIKTVISDHTSEVKHLISGKSFMVHNNRLKFYNDSSLDVTDELLKTIQHNHPHYNTVTKFLDLRYNKGQKQYEVLTKWRGFTDEQPGWEPLQIMHEDVPEFLETFLQSHENKELVSEAKTYLASL